MPKKKMPKDTNKLAKAVVDQATGDSPEPQPTSMEEYAKQFARKGGIVGGPARAKKLSAKRRKEIAKKAAEARWGRKGNEETC